MNYVFRLKKGQDLKKEIVKFAKDNNIEAGIIKCAVGCVYEANFRLAGADCFYHKEDDFEIVSITGTVSKNGCHIHISLADKDGNTVGGHLTDGCLINTTCEVCIESFDNYYFDRVFDDETGYKELVIKNKNDIKKI